MINQDKTEALLLRNNASNSLDLGKIEIKKIHKNFDGSLHLQQFTFNLRDMFKGWGWRGLTIIGKIQVMKSFALTKILYRLTMITNKKEFIKKANTLLYSFVWKGIDRVKRAISPQQKMGAPPIFEQ